MLLRRILGSLAPSRVRSATRPQRDRVQTLPGFNVLVHARHGVFLVNENDVYIGCALIDYGEYCEPETALLASYCAAGAVVAEIGANIGAQSVALAKRVGPEGRLVAVEPQPFVFQMMCANLALNCLSNVDAFNCGCGSEDGTLAVPPIDYGDRGNFGLVELGAHDALPGGIEVAVKPLDALLRPSARVDLLKIDVEGMESEVLRGARATIARFRPVLYIENDRIEKSRALIALVHELGYRAWWHMTPLFNPANYFDNPNNRYPAIASCNMLCLPDAREPQDARGLSLVTDPSFHPFAR